MTQGHRGFSRLILQQQPEYAPLPKVRDFGFKDHVFLKKKAYLCIGKIANIPLIM